MKPLLSICAASLLAISLPTADAWAKGKPDHAGGKGKSNHAAAPAARHCPPGLARKNPPCVPPGLAKKGVTEWERDDERHRHFDGDPVRFTRIVDRDGRVIAVGDVVDDGYDRYVVLREPGRYGLPPLEADEMYLQVGDAALRLDRDTRRVLTILALGNLLTR